MKPTYLLLVLLTIISYTATAADRDSKPNVIIIYADDLGRGLLSSEGQKIIKTPHIDKLAKDGVRFENVYGSMLCAPARASLLTGYHDCHKDKWEISQGGAYINITKGKYTQQEIEEELNNNLKPIPEEEVYLAEVFQKSGYITGEIGKLEWGFSATDKQMKRDGWDYYYGYLDHVKCHGFYPPFLFENGTLVNIPGNTRADCGKTIERETEKAYQDRWNMEGKAVYSQDLFLEKILGFIRDNKDKPFFLYHPTQLPHGPVAIPEVRDIYMNNNDLTQIEKEYASMVSMLDDHVGIIMKELKKLGIDKNTMVIFSSDNGHEIYYTQEGRIVKPVQNMATGERFNDIDTKFTSEIGGDIFNGNDGMAGLKRSSWEGGVRVPLIVRWPGKIKRGSNSDVLVTNYDLLTTMADLVGYDLQIKKDGVSYLPELLGEPHKEHDYVIFSSFNGPAIVTNDGWKLRYIVKTGESQLYHLPNDYQETNNIIEANQEKANQLFKILKEECEGDLRNGLFSWNHSIMESPFK